MWTLSTKRALVCGAALALLFAACGEADDTRPARERFDAAVADYDFVGARSAAVDLGEELPDTPGAVIEVARLLGEIGEMNEARWMLREALKRHPGQNDLRVGLAETSLRVGDAEGARVVLEGFPEGVEQSAYVEVLRARAAIQLGALGEGLEILERAQERFDEPVLFRLERIDVLAGEQRNEEALAIVAQMRADATLPEAALDWLAIRASDLVGKTEGPEAALARIDEIWARGARSADVATRRTSLLVGLGRAPEALAQLRAALNAQPDAGALYPIAAQAAIAAGDLATAERLYRQHIEFETSATSLSNLALFLNRLGRVGEAAELLADLPELADPVQRIELHYLAIALQIEAGDIDKARPHVEAFGREYPRNPRLGYLQARLALADGNPGVAAKQLSEVLTRFDRPDVKHLLGVALERAGDPVGAELRYGLAAQQSPQQIPSWLGLLRTLEVQGKWDRAAEVAQRVIRLAPVGAFAYQALANAKIAVGRPDEAEELLRDYVAAHPGRVGPRVALSLALRRQARAAEALAVLDEADEVQARSVDLATERAVVLAQLGRVAEAFDVLAAAEVTEPEPRARRHARIYLLFAAGRGEDALSEAKRAVESDALDAVPHRMTADYLASLGRFDDAVEPYRRALALVPDGGVAFRLGVALERCGRDAEAKDAYRRAIEIDEAAVGPRNNLALVLARGGQTQAALEMAQSAYARAETDPVVMDTLASLYLESGLAARAAALLEKARRSDSESADSAEIAYHLALAYRDSDRQVEARALLADLDAELEPDHVLRGPLDDALESLR